MIVIFFNIHLQSLANIQLIVLIFSIKKQKQEKAPSLYWHPSKEKDLYQLVGKNEPRGPQTFFLSLLQFLVYFLIGLFIQLYSIQTWINILVDRNNFNDKVYLCFFSGNTIIHELTTKYANSLYIRIEKLQDHMVKFAHYSSFSLSNETDGFRLSLGSYSGNASKFKTFVIHTCIRWIFRRYYAIC